MDHDAANAASEHETPPSTSADTDDAADRALVERVRAAEEEARRADADGDQAARAEARDRARAAWGELLGRHERMLFAVCVRTLGGDRQAAADVVQDAMIKIIRGMDSWDGRSRLTTWMVRVAMNTCLSHLRKAKLRKHASLDAMGGGRGKGPATTGGKTDSRTSGGLPRGATLGTAQGAGEDDAERELAGERSVSLQEQRAAVARAMDSLSLEHRTILILRDIQGLEYEELATALDIAAGTVKSRLFRARAALRDALEQDAENSDFRPPLPPSPPTITDA